VYRVLTVVLRYVVATELNADMSNPIAQERVGEGYLAGKGNKPFLQ
jgi:hypothetical protein